MEEAPNPLSLETPKEKILEHKEFLINTLNEKYNLIIERDSSFIYFKLYKSDEIDLYYYKNELELESIIKNLKLNSSKFRDLKDIFILIEKCYCNNNIFLQKNNDIINLIIKNVHDSNTDENKICLFKSELNINESFDLIFKQIKKIKSNENNILDDRLSVIEVLLNDIKSDADTRINEGNKEINIIQEKVLKDVKEIKERSDEINKLKEKISYIKSQKENLKIDNKKN